MYLGNSSFVYHMLQFGGNGIFKAEADPFQHAIQCYFSGGAQVVFPDWSQQLMIFLIRQ